MKILDKLKETINKVKGIFSSKDAVQLLEAPKQNLEVNGFDKYWKEQMHVTETPKDIFKKLLSEKGIVLSDVVMNVMYSDLFDRNEQIESISFVDSDRMEKISDIMNKRLANFRISGNKIISDVLQRVDEKGNIDEISQNIYSKDSIIRKESSISNLNYYSDGSHSGYTCISSEEMIKYDPQRGCEMEVSKILESKNYQASRDAVMPDPFNSRDFQMISHIVTTRGKENNIIQMEYDEKGNVVNEKTGKLNSHYDHSQKLPRDEFNFSFATSQEQDAYIKE